MQVITDQADDTLTDFTLPLGGLLRVVGHSQVGAEDVNAGLLLWLPVIG